MRPCPLVLVLWHWSLLLLVAAPVKGDIKDSVDKWPHATLVKDGKPTNCFASLISDRACAVVASCLDYTSSGVIDKDVIYDVYVSDNNDFAATSLRVKRVTVHPKYNPENHVNDIAVLEYDSQSSSSFHYDQGAYYMDYWVGHAFGQKYLVDVEKNQWSDLAFSTFDWTITETCDKYSEMYNTNVDYIICDDRTPATDLSPNNLGCPLPVGATFGIFEDKTVVTGLYSYTVLDGGNDICSAKSYRVYYTALYPYIGFFEVVVGGKIPTVGDITTPVMVDRDFEEDKNSGRKFVGKGFTRELGAETKPESSSEDSSIDTEDSEFSTDDSLNDSGDSESSTEGFSNDSGNSESSTNDDDGSEGLSRQAVIAIAVCVPVIVLLLLGIGLWFYCRRRNRHRYDDMVNPITSDHYQDMLVVEQPAETPVLVTSETGAANSPAAALLLPDTTVAGAQRASTTRQQLFAGDDLDDLPPHYDDAAESNSPSAVAAGATRPLSSATKLDEKGAVTDGKK